ncbi:OBG GTPase family GTP-binding protein [Desulfurococcus mucosus]|uniref:Small GTP-binding protein n=1 Tax=Desulfurococcus mucosus (strain ATCC 35584 / DSM 2162 / JCM 9187 / O7/1) TaxID=765177 RepID=E8R737_DESM0|nr:GTP-binding protein [Desulfurococcus mucosus]ADV64470.1 small GTP-binding protein [Desulfurococcus mucosus DSM 2162]
MVTNLPAEAKAKWIKVMEAKTPEEKIRALEDFLSSVPKHKGTEKLRLWATRRLAELRDEIEERRKKKTGRGAVFFVEKEGDVQVVVLGPPNTGKSMLVNKLTGARTVIADYPFSTTQPVPGMLKYEDIYIQLIDTPPLSRGSGLINKIIGLARNADGLLIVLDATRDIIADFEELRGLLEDSGVVLSKPLGRVVIEAYRSGRQGIRFTLMGKLLNATLDDVRRLLEEYRIHNAHVKIYGEVTLDDVEQALFENTTYKPSVVFVNKVDLVSGVDEVVKVLGEKSGLPVIAGSAFTGLGLNKVGEALFTQLELIRVYTKSPNTDPSSKPLVLRKGATIRDVAESIHRDFVKNFVYAKVWGKSVHYPGERVGLEHVVEDGDIVEIHIRG